MVRGAARRHEGCAGSRSSEAMIEQECMGDRTSVERRRQ
jgi:hypothetical protein